MKKNNFIIFFLIFEIDLVSVSLIIIEQVVTFDMIHRSQKFKKGMSLLKIPSPNVIWFDFSCCSHWYPAFLTVCKTFNIIPSYSKKNNYKINQIFRTVYLWNINFFEQKKMEVDISKINGLFRKKVILFTGAPLSYKNLGDLNWLQKKLYIKW